MPIRSLLASLLLVASPLLQAAEKVVIYNWTEYIPDGVLEDFTAETGIEVDYSTYDNNETMYAKLKLQQGKGYDIVVPSAYMVSKMREEGLLHPIDKTKLSHFGNLDPKLLDKPFDPGNGYSIPYMWGSTGIAVNAAAIDPASITGWADLWEPKWKGKLLLTDDLRGIFDMALKKNGFSSNSTNPEEIKVAYQDLQKLMPNVRVFNADAPREPFLAGDVNLGMIWSGEASQAQKENKDIHYIYPKEGASLWVDNLAITAGAENVDNAHKFIDYMLRPKVAKQMVEKLGYSTPNTAARVLVSEAIRNDPIIFPPAEILEKGEFQLDVGAALKLYNDYWEKLKAGH
ncbi:extracellular solute-binding protein [Thiothrix nivea]|uniref:Putrescine-binding periplasmic protein n=1 Tax=Thiothrix nivea (strain ATCC 35100 / DSM 5205 / JP2) TaxID=870187 RepID=A0A656HJQ6_THINJ|nr:extracellular solute-binding protein [Thiothrix nivea]EIJ36314.1 extracellular solute-binding protein family 1 [Thiothrix nivea DSM 5205]